MTLNKLRGKSSKVLQLQMSERPSKETQVIDNGANQWAEILPINGLYSAATMSV